LKGKQLLGSGKQSCAKIDLLHFPLITGARVGAFFNIATGAALQKVDIQQHA
jgi:hypothetical protein